MSNVIENKTPSELSDKIQEEITEQGWHLKPINDNNLMKGFYLVPPMSDGRNHMCAKWTQIPVYIPDYLYRP